MTIHYGDASRVVLNRDLNELKEMGLVEPIKGGSRARSAESDRHA